MDNCKELFLDDIVKISIHPVAGCRFPIPFSVPAITSMTGTLSTPVLEIGYGVNEITAVEESISAQCSTPTSPNRNMCDIEITASIEGNDDSFADLYIKIGNKDHHVCLHKSDGTRYLCYSLPHTFQYNAPISFQSGESRQLSLTMKSNSEFIKLTD